MYTGTAVTLRALDSDIAELIFKAEKAVNTLNSVTLTELEQAVSLLESDNTIQGLLVSSANDAFIVGADITEFTTLFREPRQRLIDVLGGVHRLLNRIEELPKKHILKKSS